MGTRIRPNISEKNKYWIEKHRYYELKHFCLQYPIWRRAYLALNSFDNKTYITLTPTIAYGDPTAKRAISQLYYSERIDMIERVAKETDNELWNYILIGIIEQRSYDNIKARLDIPCSRETYYDRYRRFFWLLDKERQ